MNYEIVIGLEVHVELATKSKIFCSCNAEYGSEHNKSVCPACCGMPGMLPVMNKDVVNRAMKAGMILNCDINRTTTFDKKSYYYPDLPCSYQTTQWFSPICINGGIEIDTSSGKKTIHLKQIHMEEDAGKLVHDDWTDTTFVDFNRTSVPLIEIVSKPELSSSDEVIAYLERLRSLLRYAGVSRCRWEEGSMRCDVNISVRPEGSTELGVRTEIKNMNSLSAIERAIDYETARHIDAIKNGTEVLIQETRKWDDVKGQSFSMRNKETAADYRYFPDPNVMPIVIDDAWFNSIKSTITEYPEDSKERYCSLGLTEADSEIIVSSYQMRTTFEQAMAQYNQPKEIANWLITECMSILKKLKLTTDDLKLDASKLIAIIQLEKEQKINRGSARKVLLAVFENDVDPLTYCEENHLIAQNDEAAIRDIVTRVLQENDKSVQDYKNGKTKALQSLFGCVMKELKGIGNPAVIQKMLAERLDS